MIKNMMPVNASNETTSSTQKERVKLPPARPKITASKISTPASTRIVPPTVTARISGLKKVIDKYKDIFGSLTEPYKYKVTNDRLTNEIYSYLTNKHTRGSNKKPVTIGGITYADIDEAVEKTGLSKRTIYRKLKTQS